MNFCIEYKVFNNSVKESKIKKIEQQLENVEFVENLINIIFIKAKQHKKLEDQKILDLLIELEKLRLKLENNKE